MRGILRGVVSVEIKCRWPERFINICAMNGVEYFGLRKTGEGVFRVETHIADYRRLRLLSGGGFTIKVLEKRGAPFLIWNLRRRWALWAALPICVLAVWASSFFILEIDVTGNETVQTGEILAALEETGVGIGTMRLFLPMDEVANEMLIKVPKLSWIAVNFVGSRAHVLVREEIPAPEIYDKSAPADIVAGKGGIIKSIFVTEGDRLVSPGETVAAGDVLVSGSMTSLSSGDRLVRARGEILARTWYELSAKTPLYACEKAYTGRSETKFSLIFAGKRLNLYFNCGNPYGCCDKIILEKRLTLFGGDVLPVTFVREEYAEYVPERRRLDMLEAEKTLKIRLEKVLEESVSGGRITAEDFSSAVEGNCLTVTLKAECLESIGKTREIK